jgi:CRISPR/Cas system-associated protein Cas10 (large subunit of type III CRISPR-Cas system)
MVMEGNMDTMHEGDLDKKWMGLWEEHVAWTRFTIISLVDIKDPAETIATENRLLKNTKDMAEVCRMFYGEEAANKFDELMTEHLTTATELVQAAVDEDNTKVDDAEKKWYKNADEIAATLNMLNSYWEEKEMKNMLYDHLRLTKAEAMARLNKDYATDISTYNEIENQARMMADGFSHGIIMQFPDKFHTKKKHFWQRD